MMNTSPRQMTIDAFTPGSTAIRVVHSYGGSRPEIQRFMIIRRTATQVIGQRVNKDGTVIRTEPVRFSRSKYAWDFQEVGSTSEEGRYTKSDAPLLPEGDPRIAQAQQQQVAWDARQARDRAIADVITDVTNWRRYGRYDATNEQISDVIAKLYALLPAVDA